jgi:hypothetical protein
MFFTAAWTADGSKKSIPCAFAIEGELAIRVANESIDRNSEPVDRTLL